MTLRSAFVMKENLVNSSKATDAVAESRSDFHVVGIGASAGGLEALESFFEQVPVDSGMAFVVIQHLSPDFKSHMGELISRKTQIPVHQVADGMQVLPNAIYLLPARMEMVISAGKLLLTERSRDRKVSHPIDQFFRSLAHDRGRYAIAIVLSGTGTDGSRGICEVHDVGGLVISQDEASAKFDGMPWSAQTTGVVDVVLPPQSMVTSLLRYTQEGVPRDKLAGEAFSPESIAVSDRIFQRLRRQFGVDFAQYKSTTVGRRLHRRLDLLGIQSLEVYADYLATNSKEQSHLYRDLLIGVTRFFRDPEAYAALAEEVIPGIFDRAAEGKTIRVWVAGCASGEEAYSIAILLDEERRRRELDVEITIFATDAHPSSIQTAARGIYSVDSVEDLSDERRNHYFRRVAEGFQVSSELRQLIVFAPHNVISDAPFTQMDLVTCRNLLIYLQSVAQAKALSLFHFALKSGGTLFLGPSESPGDLSDEFQVTNSHWRIYLKRRDHRMPLGTPLPLSPHNEKMPRLSFTSASQSTTRVDSTVLSGYDELLGQKIGSSILLDRHGCILHVFGGAERYLRVTGGRPSAHVLDLVHEQLKSCLSAALHHAIRKQDIVQYVPMLFQSDQGEEELRVSVEPIGDPVSGSGNLLVVINPVAPPTANAPPESTSIATTPLQSPGDIKSERLTFLESELQQSQENLQATIEEMETSNEELQASNEELIASNEELQSTNEELHSVNEELYSVNAEHQRRVEELAEANADMDNLLATTRVGVVFLDRELSIRRYTPQIAELLKISNHDVGRPIIDFAHRLGYEHLLNDLHEVLNTQQELESKIQGDQGNVYLLRMVPYRSGERVDGVVLTWIDITSLSAAESQLKRFQFMTESATDLIFLANRNGEFLYVNPAMCGALQYDREDLLKLRFEDIDHDCDRHRYQTTFDEAESNVVKPAQSVWVREDGSVFPVEISFSSVHLDDQPFLGASVRDITERRAAELEMRLQHLAIESTLNGIVITDPNLNDNPITYANQGFLKLTGYPREEVLGRNCRFLQGEETDPAMVANLRAAIEQGRSCRVALRNYRKDGSPFWNDLQITPVFNERDRLVHFVGVQNDITERMKVQEALQSANQDAKAASAAKSAFMANMSHELRTPMTAVLGFADMLAEELAEPVLLEKVMTIKRNGEYLLALLNDILDLSKIEAGKMDIRQQTLNLESLVAEVQTLMDVRAMEEGIPLQFRWMSEVPLEVTADETRVRQVLVNLISNALKFTDRGGVWVGIGVHRDSASPKLQFAVHDTGIGIHDSQLPDLFTPFSQSGVSSRSRFGGTGLGLSISKRLAEGMGGEITVNSEPGVGSCFTFTLPLTEAQADRHVARQQTIDEPSSRYQENLGSEDVSRPKIQSRILLADDRRDIWRIGKYFLEKCGAEVMVVEDGLQAVEEAQRAAAEGRPFELILMDMQMPVMTGRDAVSELRKLGFRTPIIALTADAMEGEREACLAMGCDDYFPKPIDGNRLMKLVALHLANRPCSG